MSIAGKGILFRRPLTLRVTRSRLPSGSSIRSFVHPFVRSASDKRVQQSRGVRTKRGATSNRRPRGSRCRCPRGGGEPGRKGNGSSSKQQHRAMSNQQQQSSRKLAMRDSPNRRANSMELAVRVSAALLTLSFFLYLVSYFSLFNTLTRHTQRWTYALSLSLFPFFGFPCSSHSRVPVLPRRVSFSCSLSLSLSPSSFPLACSRSPRCFPAVFRSPSSPLSRGASTVEQRRRCRRLFRALCRCPPSLHPPRPSRPRRYTNSRPTRRDLLFVSCMRSLLSWSAPSPWYIPVHIARGPFVLCHHFALFHTPSRVNVRITNTHERKGKKTCDTDVYDEDHQCSERSRVFVTDVEFLCTRKYCSGSYIACGVGYTVWYERIHVTRAAHPHE